MQTTVYLKDYTPPPFLIPRIDLDIDLATENDARITATLIVNRNTKAPDSGAAFTLDVDEIEIESVMLYADALYLSITVLTSTGFGDITPPARAARAVCMVGQLTGALFRRDTDRAARGCLPSARKLHRRPARVR